MSFINYNMVESTKEHKEDEEELVKNKSAELRVDNLINSIMRMEYSWEFLKLTCQKEKLAYALSHSEWKILQWYERLEEKFESYADWKVALLDRYFRRVFELKKFLEAKQKINQKLSNFIIGMESIARTLKIEKDLTIKIIIAGMICRDKNLIELISKEKCISEELIAKIEDYENFNEDVKKKEE